MSQILYVDPERKLIMVRLGEKWATGCNPVVVTRNLTRKYPVLEESW